MYGPRVCFCHVVFSIFTMTTWTCRLATPDDAKTVAELEAASYPSDESADYNKIAESENIVIYLESVCIHSVVVKTESRRAGLGCQFVQQYISHIKTNVMPTPKRLLLISKRNLVPFYSRNGFVDHATTSFQGREISCITPYFNIHGNYQGLLENVRITTTSSSPRHVLQDRVQVMTADDIYRNVPKGALTGVLSLCDGHGPDGHIAAEYMVGTLTKKIIHGFLHFDKHGDGGGDNRDDIQRMIIDAFADADNEFRSVARRNRYHAGSTATVFVLWRHYLFTAVVGDSKGAVLAYTSPDQTDYIHWIFETRMFEIHQNNLDLVRALEHGGHLARGGTYLSTSPNDVGQRRLLAMTRSLGDYEFKSHAQEHDNVVSYVPDVKIIDLDHLDHVYLVIGSDGMWNTLCGMITDAECGRQTLRTMLEANINACDRTLEIKKFVEQISNKCRPKPKTDDQEVLLDDWSMVVMDIVPKHDK